MLGHTKEGDPVKEGNSAGEREFSDQNHPVRTAVRFPIRLALVLQTPHGDVAAVTENISSSGLLFKLHEMLEVDTPIEFTMSMPAEVLGAERDVVVHCMGRVVRYQQMETEIQAGAVIDEYFFKA